MAAPCFQALALGKFREITPLESTQVLLAWRGTVRLQRAPTQTVISVFEGVSPDFHGRGVGILPGDQFSPWRSQALSLLGLLGSFGVLLRLLGLVAFCLGLE